MGKTDPLDFYDAESLLSDEERAFRDAVRGFVAEACMPAIAHGFDRGRFPMELVVRMAKMGLFGMHVGGYGCTERTHTIYGLACRELGRCDSGLRAMFSVQNSLVMYPIFALGSESQKEAWLPRMARGEAVGCFALSEPDFGSNPAGMATRAERRAGGYVLDGTKMWITNGTIAHVALVWARLEGEIQGFLVEAGRPGFEASPIQRKFSYRTSPTARLTFRRCELPEASRLPKARGLKAILQCLNSARFGVACGALGSAMACLEAARTFAIRRRAFDRTIGSYQLVQDRLVRMALEITKAQLLTLRLGRLMDEGRATPAQISMAKLNNVREAMEIARMARDILGARGILADHHVIRHLCDLEALSTLEGTENIHTLVIGQELTGLPAFR